MCTPRAQNVRGWYISSLEQMGRWHTLHSENILSRTNISSPVFFVTWTNTILMNNSRSWCMLFLSYGLYHLSLVLMVLICRLYFQDTTRQCVTVRTMWLVVTKLLQPMFLKAKKYLYMTGTWEFINEILFILYFLLKSQAWLMYACGLYLRKYHNCVVCIHCNFW
jgi:hypothetical protein